MATHNDIMNRELHAIREKMRELKKAFGPTEHPAIEMFEDVPWYDLSDLTDLSLLGEQVTLAPKEEREERIEAFRTKRDSIRKKESGPERIYLWPEGKIPTLTEYKDNSDYMYNHDPDFAPYMYPILLPEDVTPKGAVVVCAGGDHGNCTLTEGYQTCLDLVKLGYQTFLLNNRPNHNPWSEKESGADAARAIRIVRRDAGKYRIRPDQVAFAGFSNGGVTGECCILNYSGKKTVADSFPGYEPDELDAFYGAPDAFLCIYGPRFAGVSVDYTGVVYPPTFFAVGREDGALNNLNPTYADLVAHGVKVEVHTFAGTPHGVGGIRAVKPEEARSNFELWLPLADAFMQDVYRNKK